MKHYRQGDLLITEVKALPKGLKERVSLVLVEGESTGHKHRLESGKVFEGKDGLLYLLLSQNAQLRHEEHGTIGLPKGKYVVIRQREYVMADMERVVVD